MSFNYTTIIALIIISISLIACSVYDKRKVNTPEGACIEFKQAVLSQDIEKIVSLISKDFKEKNPNYNQIEFYHSKKLLSISDSVSYIFLKNAKFEIKNNDGSYAQITVLDNKLDNTGITTLKSITMIKENDLWKNNQIRKKPFI